MSEDASYDDLRWTQGDTCDDPDCAQCNEAGRDTYVERFSPNAITQDIISLAAEQAIATQRDWWPTGITRYAPA